MTDLTPPQDRPSRAPWLIAAAVIAVLTLWLTALAPPEPGEGSTLRWLRKVVEHPVRGGLALGLVLWALSPRQRPPPDDPGHGEGQGL